MISIDKKNSRFKISLWGIALLAIPLLFAGCSDEAAPAPRPKPGVAVITLKAEPVSMIIELPGRATSVNVAEVRPQVSGIILKRMFKEGSTVKEGQQLYQIDPAIYEANLMTAKADLQRAQATLESSKLLFDRYAKLIGAKAVSQQNFDDAKAAYQQALAGVAAGKASVNTAQINLNYTKVYAPVTGRIGISTVTPGALVTSSQSNPLAIINQMDKMYVDMSQASTNFLSLLREMKDRTLIPAESDSNVMPVDLVLEDGKTYSQTAKLSVFDVNVQQSTGSITLRAEVDNSAGLILPGMYVRSLVHVGLQPNSLLVPEQAVMRNQNGSAYVWVIRDKMMTVKDAATDKEVEKLLQSVAEKRLIDASHSQGNSWVVKALEGSDTPETVVKEGLFSGDRVVMEGSLAIKEGIETSPHDYIAADNS